MEDYRTFWTNVTSTKVLVEASESENDIIDTFHVDEKTDIDYYDMEVSESRTLGPRSDINPSFTVSPILVMTDKPSDDSDNDSKRHESNSFSDNIDSLGQVPESLTHDISILSQRMPSSKGHEPGTTSEKRPSILITPPPRPRKGNKYSPTERVGNTESVDIDTMTEKPKPSTTSTTTSTTQTTTTTTLSSSTTATTTYVKVSSSTNEIMFIPSKRKSTKTTSKEAITAVNVFGGIMVNARKKSTPKLMDPKYVFTTEISTQRTTTSLTEENVTTLLPSTTTTLKSTSIATTTTTSREPVTSTPVYSHNFDLTEDDSNFEILYSNGNIEENRNKTLYNVETTTVPSYDDLPVVLNSSSLDVPRLRSDLYDVMVDENATEVITIGQVTELERRPRDNDQFEHLDGAYKRLEAQYGGWENSGAQSGVGGSFLVISASLLLCL